MSPALRLYLAGAISDQIIPQKAIEAFHRNEFSRWLGVDLPLRKAKPIRLDALNLPDPDLPIPAITQAVLHFDQDKLVHILVLECDWRRPNKYAIHDSQTATADLQTRLHTYLQRVQEQLSEYSRSKRGLTLVILDSPGWNVRLQLPEDFGEDWYCAGLHAHSFSFLLKDRSFSLIDLWKMLRESRAIEKLGVRLTIWPDMLNYWSIWRAFGSTFWPETFDLRLCNAFGPDTSKIIETMRKIRVELNAHAACLPSGEWLRVERWVEDLSPSQDHNNPIYLDPISIVLGSLRCVIETSYGSWWVSSARPAFDPEDRNFLYFLWQGSAEWLLRIARSAAAWLPQASEPLEVRLLPVPKTILDASPNIEIVKATDDSVATIILPYTLLDKLMTIDNSGESIIVSALIDAVLVARSCSVAEADKKTWLANVMASPSLKMLHLTPRGDHAFKIDLVAERPSVRFLQDTDIAAAERQMRDALATIPKSKIHKDTTEVVGRTFVQAALHAKVDVHWRRCKETLRTLDRAQTLALVCRLIEGIHRDRITSERSAAARRQHYSESPEYELLARVTISNRDSAFRAYRVIAEMAVCECPVIDGRSPGLTDIDALAAEVTTLIEAAHDSDAVERELVTDGLFFRPDGAMMIGSGGANAFLRSYQLECIGESIALDIDSYSKLFERGHSDIGTLLDDDDLFMQAFKAEMGLPFTTAFKINYALQALAVEQQTYVISMNRSSIEERLAKEPHAINGSELASFLSCFGLFARDSWDTKPARPFTMSDIWPWIFERRLSLMLRPILITEQKDDPLLIYGVRQIDMGVRYAAILFETGDWPKSKLTTSQARAFVDAESNRRGLAFEVEIASLVREAGWTAIEQVSMRRLGASERLGNLDVLAISPDENRWLILECKWFGAARTPREIASWLQDFHGHPGDKLDRHLQRVEWIKINKSLVVSALKLSRTPDWIDGAIATTSPLPLQIKADLPTDATVLTRRFLKLHLRQHKSGLTT